MKKIGYFPIKETEIKEIIKLILAYKKGDNTTLDETMLKYNVNDLKKKTLYNSFEKCLKSQENKYFDTFYGVCIAETQKMYRGHFNIEDKSITQLLAKYPTLEKYTKKLEEFLKFKNNKYEFINYLDLKKSSGAYISYEKAMALYEDYYSDVQIKNAVLSYYGDSTDKFLEILEYSVENECGILEADIEEATNNTEIPRQTMATASIKPNNQEKNQNEKVEPKAVNGRTIVPTKRITGSIICYNLFWGMVFGIVYTVVLKLITYRVSSVIIMLIVAFILHAITIFVIWKASIEASFITKTIERNSVPKLMKNLIIFVVILCTLSIGMNLFEANEKIKTTYNTKLKARTEMVEKYGTEEQKAEYFAKIDESIKTAKREMYKSIMITVGGDFIIYLATMLYVKKQIIKKSI